MATELHVTSSSPAYFTALLSKRILRVIDRATMRSCVFLLVSAFCAVWHASNAWQAQATAPLLAKPALVPFTDDVGSILIHVSGDLLQQCRDPLIEISDEKGLLYVKTHLEGVSGTHTDRFDRQWMHVSTDLTGVPYGVTRVAVRACGETVVTKVVKAKWRKGTTFTVDNIRGQLIDADGFPFILFGSYIYGVTTDVERGVPEAEIQFGMNWIGPYLSESGGHSNATWSLILSFLDRCHQIGVHVHYDLHQLATLPDTPTKWELLQKEVQTVMNHPAVAAYYLADEPGGQGIDPSLLEKSYDFVKNLDPNKPITEVFCCVDPAKYINSFDIGMADPYPIPNSSPFYVAARAAELVNTGKPFFIVAQAFGGGELWEREPTPGAFGGGFIHERTPTPAEERAMTYIAMLSGAIGIQYFIRSPGQFPYAATAWSECRRLSLEFRELSSAILSGGQRVTVTPSVSQGVMATGWEERLEGTWVVAAVNYINAPMNLTLTTNVSYTGPATVVFQDRMVNITGGVINDIITGYGSAVYRFPPIKSSKVSPSNLLANPSFEEVTSASSPDGAYLNVPTDPASTYLTDSRFSVDGLHSLQLTTPTKSGGFDVLPYPTHLTAGTKYEMSFWAMSTESGLTLQFDFSDLTPSTASYQTDTQWKMYNISLTATSSSDRVNTIHFQLVSNGTVWIDLLQLIPQS